MCVEEEEQTESVRYDDSNDSGNEESIGSLSKSSSKQSTTSSTPIKMRSIEDIYARCHMCITEPERYQEVAEDIAWQEAMKAELEMIEKNKTWEVMARPIDKSVIGVK